MESSEVDPFVTGGDSSASSDESIYMGPRIRSPYLHKQLSNDDQIDQNNSTSFRPIEAGGATSSLSAPETDYSFSSPLGMRRRNKYTLDDDEHKRRSLSFDFTNFEGRDDNGLHSPRGDSPRGGIRGGGLISAATGVINAIKGAAKRAKNRTRATAKRMKKKTQATSKA